MKQGELESGIRLRLGHPPPRSTERHFAAAARYWGLEVSRVFASTIGPLPDRFTGGTATPLRRRQPKNRLRSARKRAACAGLLTRGWVVPARRDGLAEPAERVVDVGAADFAGDLAVVTGGVPEEADAGAVTVVVLADSPQPAKAMATPASAEGTAR
jgi:hypothetical protein